MKSCANQPPLFLQENLIETPSYLYDFSKIPTRNKGGSHYILKRYDWFFWHGNTWHAGLTEHSRVGNT